MVVTENRTASVKVIHTLIVYFLDLLKACTFFFTLVLL